MSRKACVTTGAMRIIRSMGRGAANSPMGAAYLGRVDDMNDIGKIGWFDLTVTDASAIRDFYSKVVGWKSQDVSMGEYQDFNMTMPESGEPAAGICHARGGNAELPSQWLIYITVADVDKSAELCRENGGAVIVGPKSMGDGKFCVIEDPNGSVAALYQSG